MEFHQVMRHLKPQAGFTLIEILVAVSIIGGLAALLLANFQGVRARARDTQRKNDTYQIKEALRMYYIDNQAYPASTTDGNIGSNACEGSDCTWGVSLFGTSANPFMKKLPNDPLASSDSNYAYIYYCEGGDDFTLFACLENASDPQAVDEANCPSGKKVEVSND